VETKTIVAIIVMAAGLLLYLLQAGQAEPMGTAFTYQGRLIDNNEPANGLYEFEFKLYDSPTDGNQLDGTVSFREVDVNDGYFTVVPDFGSDVFDGDAHWLEIGVRYNTADPHSTLSPRQRVTPCPYALYARNAGSDSDWMVLDSNMYSMPSGNVGIGTTSPSAPLDVTNSGGRTAISGSSSWIGVYGIHNASTDTFPGVWGETNSLSDSASGVRGKVTSTSPGSLSAGVWGINASTGGAGFGVRGTHSGSGTAVYGEATMTGGITNYGGYFTAAGGGGVGVFGEGTDTTGGINYGGYFVADGPLGYGVFGKATSASGTGVYGWASSNGIGTNCGGYFMASGTGGRGVKGYASNSGIAENYGGHFEAKGTDGCGVYGLASSSGNVGNHGGYFEAAGKKGIGAYGYASNSGTVLNFGGVFKAEGQDGTGVKGIALAANGIGVHGVGGQYDFYADGPGENYGSASSIRWKRNIQAIDNPLEKIVQLRGVYFNWDPEHGGGHDVGMIAEEVGKVLPEIVQYEEDCIYASGMDYGRLTPLLVEAVKALKKEASEQEKQLIEKGVEIAVLKKENELIKACLATLEFVVAEPAGFRTGGLQ